VAIQFTCESCQQAIEVDDDQGNRLVSCPFCQQTVRAPLESTLPGAVPPARPAAEAPPPGPAPAEYIPAPPPATEGLLFRKVLLRSNRFGNWGLAAGLLAWVTLAVMVFTVLSTAFEKRPFDPNKPVNSREATEAMQQAVQEVLRDPAMERKMIAFELVIIGLLLMSIVLSVIGLRQKGARMGTSIAGMIVSGSLLICFLSSMLIGPAM
jgi:hypothetical protein